MNLDELKDKWGQIGNSASEPQSYIETVARSRNTLTARDRLVRTYRAMCVIAPSAGIFLAFPVMEMFGMWIAIAYMVFMFAAFAMDLTLLTRVKAIDVAGMGVAEVSARALACRKLHHRFQLLLIPAVILLITAMVMTQASDEYMVVGMVAGALVGAALGLLIYFRQMSSYRRLIERPAEPTRE